MKQVSQIILGSLISNEKYTRKVLPYLNAEYFDGNEKKIFSAIKAHINKYNTLPTKESLSISFDESNDLNENEFKDVIEYIDSCVDNLSVPDDVWLMDTTEKYVKDKAIYNAIMNSIKILDEEKHGKPVIRGAIPNILSEALSVNFDERVGHDYTEDIDERFDFYHRKERRFAFDLSMFNKITKGGFTPKSLNLFLSPTHAGKTLVKCHLAANYLAQNHNVLYITMEMAEEKIAERIDANLLNMTMKDLSALDKAEYTRRLTEVKRKMKGKLIIKEYPPVSANVTHFRHLLQELKLKKKFVPDVICIDYLNICASSRLKHGNNVNSYNYIKAVAEEIRGLAVEFNAVVVSSTQTNRDGYSNSDIELTSTSDSMGIVMTADFVAAIIRTEELDQANQIMFKQLKNRYDDLTSNTRFVVGVERSKMRLFDVSDSAQRGINIEKTGTDSTKPSQKPHNKFSGIRV